MKRQLFVCVFFIIYLYGGIHGKILKSSRHIVGGRKATRGAFPYQVSLRLENGNHFCGGSIISSRWILTAAHCLYRLGQSSIIVVAGTNNLPSSGWYYHSRRHIIHPDFNYNSLKNDVALVMLNSTISFNKVVRPIALPANNIDANNYPAVVSGWGTLEYRGSTPMNLRYSHIKILSLNNCYNYYGAQISNSNICTIARIGRGNCHGDSGGPLVANNVQIGIVSFGQPCALGYPDVYTRVWSYKDWIEHYIS